MEITSVTIIASVLAGIAVWALIEIRSELYKIAGAIRSANTIARRANELNEMEIDRKADHDGKPRHDERWRGEKTMAKIKAKRTGE